MQVSNILRMLTLCDGKRSERWGGRGLEVGGGGAQEQKLPWGRERNSLK
jgi:hypothetical protein